MEVPTPWYAEGSVWFSVILGLLLGFAVREIQWQRRERANRDKASLVYRRMVQR